MSRIFNPLILPNGQIFENRLCKAAMEENMAEPGQLPGKALVNLYKAWGEGAPGLILTGNVMVDPKALTGPGGVVLQKGTLAEGNNQERFERWAAAAKAHGSKVWMQISHPGRQVYASQCTEVVSASATKVNMAGAEKMFDTARALTGNEIKAMITRFADAAAAAEASGFDGVEIHGAHGYLVAQFLSPLTNKRGDEWGGPLENRARFLLEIVRAVRARVSDDFGIGVKLNSADFQKGGFDVDDARGVVEMLNAEDIDLVELSGGSYESAAMMGMADDERLTSTTAREMYFLEFAADIAKTAHMPIMVTGGVTKQETAEKALASRSVDMVGIARAFAYSPQLPKAWVTQDARVDLPIVKFKSKLLTALGTMSLTKTQLHRLGAGKMPKPQASPLLSVIADRVRVSKKTKSYKTWLNQQS